MKHLKKFEQHSNDEVNEWFGQETITGWKSKEDKFKAKEEIISQINQKIEKAKENLDAFVKFDENTLRQSLLNQAEEDNFKGKVLIQREPTGKQKYHIVYWSDRKKYSYRTL